MRRLYPGPERGFRRFVVVCILTGLGVALVAGAGVLHASHDVRVPDWLWLLFLVSGLVFGAVEVLYILSVYRETQLVRRQ